MPNIFEAILSLFLTIFQGDKNNDNLTVEVPNTSELSVEASGPTGPTGAASEQEGNSGVSGPTATSSVSGPTGPIGVSATEDTTTDPSGPTGNIVNEGEESGVSGSTGSPAYSGPVEVEVPSDEIDWNNPGNNFIPSFGRKDDGDHSGGLTQEEKDSDDDDANDD